MQLKVSFCHLPFDRFWQWYQQHHKERSPECSSLWKIILWQPQNSNWFVVVTVKLKSWWRHGSVQNRYQPQYLLLVLFKMWRFIQMILSHQIIIWYVRTDMPKWTSLAIKFFIIHPLKIKWYFFAQESYQLFNCTGNYIILILPWKVL